MLGHFDFEEMEALIERNAGSDEEKRLRPIAMRSAPSTMKWNMQLN